MKLFGFKKRKKAEELKKLKEAEVLKNRQANCVHDWEYKSEWVHVSSDGASDDTALCCYYRCRKCGKTSRRPEGKP